ncbi:MAG: NACHT domain-containing protein [Cyanobacteria bacterium J06621_3]
MTQADVTLPEEADKLSQLMEWMNQVSVIGRAITGFGFFALAIAAIVKITDNLDKILSFKAKYFSRAPAGLPEKHLENLRDNLLQRMKTDVARRLYDSLHNLVTVDIEQEEQRHQVGRQKTSLVKAEERQPTLLENLIQRSLKVLKNSAVEPVSVEKTYSIFHRDDIGGRLLILGEPGAGKTTELLTVAQRLVKEAIEDHDKPIPLIFELYSWPPNTPILSWLGQQMHIFYGVSKVLAEPLTQLWIEQNQLLLLLDGLDELGMSNQVACMEALEAFLAQHPALPAIVCCRREEYKHSGKMLLQLNGALCLQAVRPPQIQPYLEQLGREQLWADIQRNDDLIKLAKSPLFLTMLVVAYQDQPIRDTDSLFNAYIDKQLHDPNHEGTYKPGKEISPQQSLRYLTWLAKQLQERQETTFLIENLQPDWLSSKQQKQIYRIIIGFIVIPIGAFKGFAVGMLLGALVLFGLPLILGLLGTSGGTLILGLWGALGIALILGLLGALGIALESARGIPSIIDPKEHLKLLSSEKLMIGLIMGLLITIGNRMSIGGVIAGLVVTPWVLLVIELGNGPRNEVIEKKQVPNQGIRKSLQNALNIGLICGIGGSLSIGLSALLNDDFTLSNDLIAGLWIALAIGFWGALRAGLWDAFRHFILRICLTKSGDIPWNYAQFLEHAARHRFIQRTGGRYRFIHDLLREHFAQMTPQQQALLAQKTDK